MRWAVLAALASARLLRGANETVPCELPEDLRNHTANGWSHGLVLRLLAPAA